MMIKGTFKEKMNFPQAKPFTVKAVIRKRFIPVQQLINFRTELDRSDNRIPGNDGN